MKIRIIHTFIFIALFLFLSSSLSSQVTIGLGEPPVSGALLQIKDIENMNDGSANSTKGVSFPRVFLEKIDALHPCVPDHVPGSKDLAHIGLTVYNVSKEAPFVEGLYVWGGFKWLVMKGETSPWLISGTTDVATCSTDNIYAAGNVVIGVDQMVRSAALNVNTEDKGFLPPRLTLEQRESIQEPVAGLLIYNTETACLEQYRNEIEGWYNLCSRTISGEGNAKMNFGNYKVSGPSLEVDKPIEGSYTVSIPYTDGNGGAYTATSVTVNGLTASIADGSFVVGDGVVVFNITGTPILSEISTCDLTLGGVSCSFKLDTRTRPSIANDCTVLYGANIPSYPMCATMMIDNEIVGVSKSIVGTLPKLIANPESVQCGISMLNDGSVMRLGKDLKSITLVFSKPVNRIEIVSNWHAYWDSNDRWDSHRVTTNSTGTISPTNIVGCIQNFIIEGIATSTIDVKPIVNLMNGLSYVVEATTPYTELTLSVGDANYDEILVAFSLCKAFVEP